MENEELVSADSAEIVAAEFATAHDLDERKARQFAKTWFNQGENFPERTDAALRRLLSNFFGLR
jgi:hypothetical protein